MTAPAAAAWVVHQAGPISSAGLQSCTKCGVVLVDYQGAHPTPFGYPRRAQVARLNGAAVVCIQHEGQLLADMRLCTEVA